MAAYGRPALRALFDDSPTPHIAHPPRTHHRDFYVATDGSYRDSGAGGLGVLIETRDGETVARLSVADTPPNNNVAEYRALHLGLDVLADRAPEGARVGVVLDHNDLAANVNRAVLAGHAPDAVPPHPFRLPERTNNHWRGIRARIGGFSELRAARLDSGENPAHALANDPAAHRHLAEEPTVTLDPDEEQIPPPSRADRHAD